MIPLSRVITEIEKHASIANRRGDDVSIRESLLAIRALCDVALSESTNIRIEESRPAQPVQAVQQPASVASVSAGERLKDDGANGDSLFDF